MLLRPLFILTLTFGLGVKASACSCAPWSGYVSEFSENYISVWAVPTKANVNIGKIGTPAGGVTYKLEVLEGFGRVNQTSINVSSNVADGGSCGLDLTMGLPQFISAIEYDTENYALSMCTPLVPYDALKHYLQTGEDSFIPEWLECHSWPKDQSDETPIFNKQLKMCAVWKDSDHILNEKIGAKDALYYRKDWWNRIKTSVPEKKRPWWHFKKD